jgi:ParB-like partition proteins
MGLKDRLAANAEAKAAAPVIANFEVITAQKDAVQFFNPKILHPFEGHTFQIDPNQADYLSLHEAIREHGITLPLIVRPHRSIMGEYEIISGHRRREIALDLGIHEVPCILKPMDDDTAIQLMGISNIQRPGWLPSEKAKTYKAHLEATQRKTGIAQGGRTDLTSANGLPKLRNRDEAGKIWGITGQTLDMYIKLNDLVPELLTMTDREQITVTAGYQVAFLCAGHQHMLADILEANPKSKLSKVIGSELRTAAEMEQFTEKRIFQLLGLAPQEKEPHAEIRIRFVSSSLLKSSTVKKALEDERVIARIEDAIRAFADEHDLPVK